MWRVVWSKGTAQPWWSLWSVSCLLNCTKNWSCCRRSEAKHSLDGDNIGNKWDKKSPVNTEHVTGSICIWNVIHFIVTRSTEGHKMHPDGFCCCLQASCQWQLRLRCRPKISVVQFGATIVNDFSGTGGEESQTVSVKYFRQSGEQVYGFHKVLDGPLCPLKEESKGQGRFPKPASSIDLIFLPFHLKIYE